MINRYQPHIHVLPEDDANRQIANGFLLDPGVSTRRIQVLPVAGGWTEVLSRVESTEMERYPKRVLVLLIDFDGQEDRLTQARSALPSDLVKRVLIRNLDRT